jgi:hypothetical protein
MNDKEQDNYELPPGVVLPQDNSVNYPNWKKGTVYGILCGILAAFLIALSPLSNKITYMLLTFLIGFLTVGSIVAFRPPKT